MIEVGWEERKKKNAPLSAEFLTSLSVSTVFFFLSFSSYLFLVSSSLHRLQTIELDLQQHNLGLNSAWKRVQDRSKWRKLMETAMSCQGRAT